MNIKPDTKLSEQRLQRVHEIINFYNFTKESFQQIYYKYSNKKLISKYEFIKTLRDLKLVQIYFQLPNKTYKDREVTRQNTLLEDFGCVNQFQRSEVKDKINKTHIKQYGSLEQYYKCVTEKSHQAFDLKSEEEKAQIRAKIVQTQIDRYGDLFVRTNQYIENSIKTNNEKYGCDWYMQTDQYKQQYHDTCNEKYGCDYFCQSEQYIKNARSVYYYDEKYFKSSWELAFYIYNKNNNVEFTYLPDGIKYKDNDGKDHIYWPDFLVNQQLIEIKGNHMLDCNGKLLDAYGENNQDKLNCKQACMDQHNVMVLSVQQIKPYLQWCKDNGIVLKDYKVSKETDDYNEVDTETGEILNAKGND